MNGQAWVTGPVGLAMWMFAAVLRHDLLEYVGSVMDTLDGAHGPGFTYLPIVYQEDCQVVRGELHHVRSDEMKCEELLSFLGAEEDDEPEQRPPNNPLQRTGSAGR